MPIIDYSCPSCFHRFEEFFHPSEIPATRPCPHMLDSGVCGVESTRIDSLPGEYQPRSARRFTDPIVVWVSNTDPNQISMPGRHDEPVQDGYHAVTLDTLQAADKFITKYNSHEREKMMETRELNRQYFDERTKARRDDIRARIGSDARLMAQFRRACEYVDKKREMKNSSLKSFDPKAHFQALAYDASNRQGFADKDTGWKERK